MKRLIIALLLAGVVAGCGRIQGPRRDRDLGRRLGCGLTVRSDGTYLLTYLDEKVDLSALKDVPVSGLELISTSDADLSLLGGMKLRTLVFKPAPQIRGIDTIRGMSSLQTINHMPAEEFWRKYDAGEFSAP